MFKNESISSDVVGKSVVVIAKSVMLVAKSVMVVPKSVVSSFSGV